MLKMNGDYNEEETAAIRLAIERANAALAEVWERNKKRRKYFISYVELSSQIYDGDLDSMIIDPLHYICGSSEEPLEV